jgi:hypothetical protein
MNILYNIFIYIFIFIIFYILNKFIFKKSKKSYELFNTTTSGLLCGTNNDVCRVNQYGISSCCSGYTCMRKEGNFQYKVCIDNNKLNSSNIGKIGTQIGDDIRNIGIEIGNIISKSPSFPDLHEYLYTTDNEIINNIIEYLNKLNINNNLFVFNLKEYLYGLLLTSEEHNYDFNDLYVYISKLNLNHYEINILINIKNYLDALNIPSNSILVELKQYLNGLNLPNNLDLKYELSNFVLLNYCVINNILNYLNTLNLSNDSNYIKLKNELENLKILIELNFNNNIEITKLNDYLNLLNYFQLQDNMTIGDLMNFLNSINIQTQNIIDFKNYINSLNLPNNITISQLKIIINNNINNLINQYVSYFQNIESLMQNLNIPELSNISYIINIKNYLNALKISNDIVLSKLLNQLNNIDLSKIGLNIGIDSLDFIERGLDIFGNYLKDFNICKI